jgi:hypothetical protein
LRFSTLSGHLIPFLIAAAIWYLVLSISAPWLPCTEKTPEYLFPAAFCLIFVYSGSQLPGCCSLKEKIMPVLFSPGQKVMSASGAESKSCLVSHKVQFIFTHSKKVITW